MGFISFPGTDTEPAKAGPGTAQRLAVVYKDYLSQFDSVYINSVFETRRKQQVTAGMMPQQPRVVPQNAFSPQQMQLVLGYSNQSIAELRAQNVSEKVIQFVEAHRSHLQRTHDDQTAFRDRFQGANQATRTPQEQHNAPNGVAGFSGSPHQLNAGQSNLIPGRGNFIDNRSQPPLQHRQPPVFHARRPTKEQMGTAIAFIQQTKMEFQRLSKSISNPHSC